MLSGAGMSATNYKIGDEFIERPDGLAWHWKIIEIRNDMYVCEDITGRAKHSPIDWVTDANLDGWLASGAFVIANTLPCAYCGGEMEAYENGQVCTECFRVKED